jgi:transposase
VLRERGIEVHDVNEDYSSQLCNSCRKKVTSLHIQGEAGRKAGVKRLMGCEAA